MQVVLLRYTRESGEAIVAAARMCYSSEDVIGLLKTVQKSDRKRFGVEENLKNVS